MKVNPDINKALAAISSESVKLANNPSAHYRYIRRIVRVFDKHLKEEDRVFIMNTFLEMIHYKSVVLDPDAMLLAANIRMRTIFFVVLMTIGVILVAGIVFQTNSSLNGLVDYFLTISRALSMTKGE